MRKVFVKAQRAVFVALPMMHVGATESGVDVDDSWVERELKLKFCATLISGVWLNTTQIF